jgi:hypothetical protein
VILEPRGAHEAPRVHHAFGWWRRTLGIEVPNSIQLLADEVIE